ncbi:hypothetical protein ACWDUL_20150 [Nocardia niigatensis]
MTSPSTPDNVPYPWLTDDDHSRMRAILDSEFARNPHGPLPRSALDALDTIVKQRARMLDNSRLVLRAHVVDLISEHRRLVGPSSSPWPDPATRARQDRRAKDLLDHIASIGLSPRETADAQRALRFAHHRWPADGPVFRTDTEWKQFSQPRWRQQLGQFAARATQLWARLTRAQAPAARAAGEWWENDHDNPQRQRLQDDVRRKDLDAEIAANQPMLAAHEALDLLENLEQITRADRDRGKAALEQIQRVGGYQMRIVAEAVFHDASHGIPFDYNPRDAATNHFRLWHSARQVSDPATEAPLSFAEAGMSALRAAARSRSTAALRPPPPGETSWQPAAVTSHAVTASSAAVEAAG